jgi:hypothetical protein
MDRQPKDSFRQRSTDRKLVSAKTLGGATWDFQTGGADHEYESIVVDVCQTEAVWVRARWLALHAGGHPQWGTRLMRAPHG